MSALDAFLRTSWQMKQTGLCIPESDPRTASSQSLAPSRCDDTRSAKRRLLVIYIHGFIGSEDSFHSFPFHVHIQLKAKIARTHVVHSKIYPRYKTYKAFHLARDNLSQWLSAHESPNTDLILVGHSMGGLLAEEVVLMRRKIPGHSSTHKHKILGTVHLDVPLLGAQNRVILAGVLSPFRSKAGVFAIPNTSSSSESLGRSWSIRTPTSDCEPDPHFNQPFANDIRIQNRGWWENVLHFARKHEDEGFIPASFRHWKAHFEFGSCLLNSHRLKERYASLRALDRTDLDADAIPHSGSDDRVRFVQFYTVSYKGRAGKRFIERNYLEECHHSGTGTEHGQSVTLARDEADQQTEESQANNRSIDDDDDPDELYFCKLAREKDGEIDPLWKKVIVATNDEINAHTVLFLPGPHYEDLVERVSTEIMTWVSELESSGASRGCASS